MNIKGFVAGVWRVVLAIAQLAEGLSLIVLDFVLSPGVVVAYFHLQLSRFVDVVVLRDGLAGDRVDCDVQAVWRDHRMPRPREGIEASV